MHIVSGISVSKSSLELGIGAECFMKRKYLNLWLGPLQIYIGLVPGSKPQRIRSSHKEPLE